MQVAYITSVLVKPVIDGYTDVVEVKQDAEEDFIQELDRQLGQTVFSAGCSNWYINKAGRNSAAWPGLAVTFWQATFFPKWDHFLMSGGSPFWLVRKTWRNVKTTSPLVWLVLAAGTWFTVSKGFWTIPSPVQNLFRQLEL